MADSLNEAGIRAVAYHAGLSDEQRTKCQEAWINDRYIDAKFPGKEYLF